MSRISRKKELTKTITEETTASNEDQNMMEEEPESTLNFTESSQNEENIAWNGKNKDKTCPIGTYSYNITIVDFKNKIYQYTGTVQLLK